MSNRKFILFSQYRDFGNVIGDSLKFCFQNIKLLAGGFLIYVVPLFLIGFALVYFSVQGFGRFDRLGLPATTTATLVFLLSLLLGSVGLFALVFSVVDAYQEQEGFPEMHHVSKKIGKFFVKVLTIFLVIFGFYVLVGGLSFAVYAVSPALAAFLLFLFFFFLTYLFIRYVFIMYIYAHENTSLTKSFSRSTFLVKNNWWWTFMIVIVLTMLVTTLSYLVQLPVMIFSFSKMFLDLQTGTMSTSPSFGVMLASGFSMLFALFVQIYFIVGIIFQYYSLREKKEGTNLMSKINQVGNYGSSEYENEGQF